MSKIGAYATIRWNNGGGEWVDVYFSLEPYDENLDGTASGIDDVDVFYYADSEEQLLSWVNPDNWENEFTILEIDEWIEEHEHTWGVDNLSDNYEVICLVCQEVKN